MPLNLRYRDERLVWSWNSPYVEQRAWLIESALDRGLSSEGGRSWQGRVKVSRPEAMLGAD